MLTIDQISKKYGDFTALEDISLELNNGVYGLLAPNGAGKTTLIKMLATLLTPTSGQILWDGEEITQMDSRYRDILGYLPQRFGYYKNYSPRKFLRYMAALKGLDRQTTEETIIRLIEMVDLTGSIDTKMKKFSGGMLQRVGIAQAMLGDPKILILDEPTAGLDPKERVRFRNIIHQLAADRIVILSTHIVSDIETIANRVIMIKDHQLYCCDTVPDICAQLDGRLFEAADSGAADPSILLLSERQAGEQTYHRFISEQCPPAGVAVKATLEDVFLWLYQDERDYV